jgi:methyl-accepting chemotaxis protein
VKNSVTAQQAATTRSRNLSLAFGGLVLGIICIAGFIVVAGVVSRLTKLKAVSDRLAKADVDGLAIDISGHDEVGAFGESLKGVKAAIEELSSLATDIAGSTSRVA